MIPKNLLLAFQLENYMNLRFLKFIYTHPKFWFAGSKRQVLEYTSKAKLILALALALCVFDIVATLYFTSGILEIFSIILIILFFPLYFVVANIIIGPLDAYLKKKIISQAKKKIGSLKDLQVIAITGSYGKTTTKEILGAILSTSYKTLMTHGTKNTPLGISRLILEDLDETYEVLIVEMGAYIPGDITELCEIVGPNISVLTGVTLQHLERFKSLDNIIDAKFEILEYLSKEDFAVVDISTTGVQKGLKEKTLQVKNIAKVKKGNSYKYKENLSGIIFQIEGIEIETKLLSNYLGETFHICYRISQHLGQSLEDFKSGAKNIDFVDHRMQLIHNKQTGVYVIDDSFNGNLEGISSILDLMRDAPFSGRKILVAGGVVELGEQTHDVNSSLGKQIAQVSDIVLLVEGPVGNALADGLMQANFPDTQVTIYKKPLDLHEDLKNIIQKGDMVIFQNDLPDTYL